MSIVIIGAGFAGASTAWWLTCLGVRDVIILEREEMPGMHSSGLNASMTRGFDEDGEISKLAEEGASFIKTPPRDFVERPLVERNGSLIIASKDRLEKGVRPKDSKILSKPETVKIVPILENAVFNHALWSPNDGVVDIHAYLWAFINGAKAKGAKILTDRGISEFKISASTIIVNAAGGWAQEVANFFGAEDLKIKPYRRHLYCTPPMKDVNPKWPFVWDIDHQYYFRPESGGLLLGPADEEEVRPHPPAINPKIREVLAEKLTTYCPSLSQVSVAREWCGLRTFAPNRHPIIRWDNKIKNFFWTAALGGFGVNCAAAVGRIAAEKICQRI